VSAKAPASATRSRAKTSCGYGSNCGDASGTRLAGVERAARNYFGDDVEAIGRDQLLAGLGSKDVVLVDVRPSEEFDAGHIEGALSIPLEELDQRLAELPDDCEIVAYCRGAYCAYAHEAVRRVRASGSQAKRLEGGWPEWQLAKRARPHLTRQAI
jgi:rhodanese-related sulfurtransferase